MMKINLLILSATLLVACSSDKKQSKPDAMKGMNAPQVANYIVLQDTTIKEVIQITGTVQAEESVDLRPEMSGKIIKVYFKEGSSVREGDVLVKINDEELRAQYNRANARLKLAQEQEYRQKVLLNKEAISQQEYHVVNTELQSMKADVELLNAHIS